MNDFPFIELDMPYLCDQKLLNRPDKNSAMQFVVNDLDNDGVLYMYLNFSSSSIRVPER